MKKKSCPENFSVILSDFQIGNLTKKMPQNLLIDLLTLLFAASKCVKENIIDQDAANTAFREMKSEFEHFAVEESHIKHRQMTAINSNDRDIADLVKRMDIPALIENSGTLKNLLNDCKGDTIDKRIDFFEKKIMKLLEEQFYPEDGTASVPDDIIHVTCTGFLSPSPVEKLVSKRKWPTSVTNAYNMDCYGAFPAARIANGFLTASHFTLAETKDKVDIVHTEFASLHLDPSNADPGNIVAGTLFSDGFIKYSAYANTSKNGKTTNPGLEILAFEEALIPDSTEEMVWKPNTHNNELFLSKSVPYLIADNIKGFVSKLLGQVDIDFKKQKDDLYFVIHPGGTKIVDLVRTVLGLTKEQLTHSYNILLENGNMSSATVPQVWKLVLEDKTIKRGTMVVSLAFGPGLTAVGMVARKV